MYDFRLTLGILVLLGTACTSTATPVRIVTPLATVTSQVTPVPVDAVTPTPSGAATLEIWLPPQFAPATDTPGGKILQQRLDAFAVRRPDVQIQVRVKSLDGPGGLLDSLTSASAAAPLSLPDLIALPRPILETAALKGLLHPYDDLIKDPEDTDWYDYALRLARLQDSLFGLPFSGDALVVVYRPETIGRPPADLAELPQATGLLAFPAADPQALFTLALYQAAGGEVLDAEGRPILQKDPLTEVLTAYQQAAQSERMPFWLTQFQSDDQAWDAFQKGQSEMVITWMSRYLENQQEGIAVAPIPTLGGEDYTLASGWVWALSGPHPESQAIAAQLAEYLSDSVFISEWNFATGYLPPRPSAVHNWQDARLSAFANRLSLSARLVPSADVLPGLAAPLVEATTEMLKLESDPASAAQAAVNRLLAP